MMPNWFGELLRDMLSGRRLQRIPRLARRGRAGLRLESLEDRSLASSTPVDVPLGTTSTLGTTSILTLAGSSTAVDQFLTSVSGFSGPGLERVLEDIQQLGYSSSQALPLISLSTTIPVVTVTPPASPPPELASPPTAAVPPSPPPPEGESNPAVTSSGSQTGATTTSAPPPIWSVSVSSQSTYVSWTFTLASSGSASPQAFTVSQAGVSAGYVTVSEAMASASYVDTFEVAAELDVVPTYEVISVSNQSQLTIDSAPPAGQVTQVQAASTTSEPGGETNPVRSPTGRELNTSGQALRADTASLAPSSPVALSQTFLPPAPSAQAAPVVSVVPVTFAPASTGTTTLELALTSFATATPPNTSLPTRVALAEVPDHVLLRQFTEQGEQPAFTELVRRHEPAVMAVTTRVLGDPHKAQDAAQSTFMILSRRASTLDGRAPLSGWLYKVAYHLALRYQTAEMRRRRVERDAANRRTTLTESEIVKQIEKEELLWVLSEELQRLPEKYRAPLALCYFQGRTHAEAAREIGLPRGSIAKRIGQGLERLRERLLDRGFLM